MSIIEIEKAPKLYRPYLVIGDEAGIKNGKIDDLKEVEASAKEFCLAEPANCQEFLEYLEKAGYYLNAELKEALLFPERRREEMKLRIPKELLPPEGFDFSPPSRPSYTPYEGGTKKPLLEFDLGLAGGAGFYTVKPLHLKGWKGVFNPGLGASLNLSEKVKAGYHIGYATSPLNSAYSFHSINHELGMSYDALHHWPNKTRSKAVELNLGGGLLLKNVFLAGRENTLHSLNLGGFASVEAGLVAAWGTWPNHTPLWTKIFVKSIASKGRDTADVTLLLGVSGTFEVY